jgi:hypothetical protein
MMKKHFVWFLAAFVLLAVSTIASRADQFSDIENSPYTYWVPPAPGYVNAPPPPYYYGGPPPPGYYGPAPGPVIVVPPPRFFFGFHFH